MGRVLSLVVLFLAIHVSACAQDEHAERFIYLFGEADTFVRVDQKYGISPIKNLCSDLNLKAISPPSTDTSGKRLFFLTQTSIPDKKQGEQLDVSLLWADHKGDLGVSQRIPVGKEPVEETRWGPHFYAKGVQSSRDGSQLLVSWSIDRNVVNEPYSEEKTTNSVTIFVLNGQEYQKQKDVAGIPAVLPGCFSADGKRYFVGTPEKILVYSWPQFDPLNGMGVEDIVGKGNRALVSFANANTSSCNALLVVRPEKPQDSEGGRIYVYDVEAGKVVFEMTGSANANYVFVPGRQLLLRGDKGMTGLSSPSTNKEGSPASGGRIHIYDMKTKSEKSVLDVPGGGNHLWVSPDETKAYYMSPRRLTVIDLVSSKVLQEYEVPYTDSQIVFMRPMQ